MATRYAVASGNWSNTATWDGGTLPGTTDNVYANGKTVTIDQSITVNSLKLLSNASPVIVAGGGFAVSTTVTITITAGIAGSDSVTNATSIITVSGSGSPTIAGNVSGGNASSGTPANGIHAVQVVSGFTGTLTISGNVASTDTGGFSASYGLYFLATAGAAVVTGNATPNSNSFAPAIGLNGAGLVTVNGNVTGGSLSGVAAAVAVLGTGNLSVGGKLSGGSVANGHGLSVAAATTATVAVTGSVTGGSVASAYGINNAGALTVRGILTPGSYSSGGVGTVAINSTSVFRYSGHIYSGGMSASTGPNGYFPISGNWSSITNEEVYLHVYDDGNFPSGNNGASRILTRYGTNNPVAADVRSGTVYGASGLLTGTLAVPPAASVASGVPVDAATGTAALKLSDVLAGTGSQIAAVFP